MIKKSLLIILLLFSIISFINFSDAKCCNGTKVNTCHELDWMHFPGGCQAAYKCENGNCASCFLVGVNPDSSIERCRTSPGCCGWGQGKNICGKLKNEPCTCEICNCGDGIVQTSAEECDNGNLNSDTQPDACRTNCKKAGCGDNVIDTNEECDDGNTQNGDTCSSTCKIELKFKSIDLFIDKDFINSTIKKRGFTPKPIFNPFTDIVCEVQVEVPEGTSEPDSFSGKLTAGIRNNEIEIASGDLVKIDKEDENFKNCIYYQWKIAGWKNGWTYSLDDMNALIENKKVKCIVNINDESKEIEKPISNCVHISGKDLAVINVLYYRDASLSNSEMSAQQLVFKSERIASLGFNEISPFREYKEKFSHYAELEQGACKKDEKILGFLKNIFKQLPPDRAGEALPGSKTAYINFNTAKDFTTAIHETGHSFCRLDDEYIVDSSSIPSENTNCRKSNFWPAEFGNQIKGCTNNDFFRSTENSIMNKDYLSQEFNIVSCGYCLREINFRQKPIEDYWKSCLSLGVVKPKIQSQHEELAEEKCFIQLNINEKKLNNNIQFALASQENVYGAYIIMPYVDDDYKIIAYDNSKNILSSQGLDSSRFVYWDGDSGGVNEFNEANLQIVIPYNPNLAYVSIKTSESEQFIEFNPNLIECKKDCKIAGESGIFSQDSCCLGVNAVPKNSSNFICTKSEDINQDGRINILDLLFVRNHLNQAVITGADIRADVNNDNKIDILDLINIRNAIS